MSGAFSLIIMFKLTIGICMLALASACAADDSDDHMVNDIFAQWIAKYGKSYATDEEWNHRKKIFKDTHCEV